jgi:hypothetical protein
MKTTSLVAMVVLFTGNLALADDYWVPSWRGGTGTTWAVWDNWTDYPNPMPSDAFAANPANLAQPYANADPGSAFLLDSWTDALGENRWNVMHIVGDDELAFHLDNYDENRTEKRVRIQITYDSDKARPLAFNVTAGYHSGVMPSHIPANQVAITEPPGWVTAAYEFTLQPNPMSEDIYLKFDWNSSSSAYVDQVVIDTWCIPEPATAALLALGALTVLCRRRRPR